jgi:hypothetical protein
MIVSSYISFILSLVKTHEINIANEDFLLFFLSLFWRFSLLSLILDMQPRTKMKQFRSRLNGKMDLVIDIPKIYYAWPWMNANIYTWHEEICLQLSGFDVINCHVLE